jgi:hypothetical protein
MAYPYSMDQYYYVTQAVPLIIERLNGEIAEQVKVLFETKHLYQKVTVDPLPVFTAFENKIYGEDRDLFQETRDAFLKATFALTPSDREIIEEPKEGRPAATPLLLLKSVKLFCQRCDSREASRPVWWSDATSELRKGSGRDRVIGRLRQALQIFTIAYQCQRCTGDPHAFLLRRDGWQFFLDGRSPFEEVEVPTSIPKTERALYRDALIAMHAGKELASLFYLRTFIEQFARRQTRVAHRVTGDELMAAYNALLPAAQRDHMPSLKDWYDRISEALHAARADVDLLNVANDEIQKHFEFRRLFRIAER